nr:putative ribonuclease H-like domain-containing protein [Tanacetum cinerariifolium]
MLHSSFDMKDMEEADVILGIRIQKNSNGYILTQARYIEKTLKKFGHYNDRPVVTPFDPKSTSIYVFTLGGAAVSWKSSKQIMNTRSTMEAEFVALDKVAEEAEWLRRFLEGIPLWPKPVTAVYIHCDTMAALTKAKNHIYNGKSRHIRRRHNMIKDLLRNEIISIDYVKSKENIVDPLTNGICKEQVIYTSRGPRNNSFVYVRFQGYKYNEDVCVFVLINEALLSMHMYSIRLAAKEVVCMMFSFMLYGYFFGLFVYPLWFGGKKESKKIQKTILKQNYKNFVTSSQEGLDKTYDRLQKLISQLEIHDTLSMNDFYNNLKVYESEIKGQSSSSSNSHNVAFVSSDNTSSTNETFNTAHNVSTASSKDQASTASYVDDIMFFFFSNQSNASQLDNKDLEQIDTDDLKEMDLKWQVAMLTMSVKRIRDASTRNEPVDTSTTNALVVQDGIGGYDWSFQAKKELTNFALMAHTSSSSSYQIGLESLEARIVVHEKNEVVYEEDIAFLKYDVQVKDISIKDLKNQLKNVLKEKDDLKLKLENFKTSSKNQTNLIDCQISATDKTGLGYDGHVNESKVLNNMVDSCENDGEDNQVNDRFKKSEGYHTVPPPYTGNYMPPRADLSFAGLDDSVFKSKESDSEDENVFESKKVKKTVKPSLEKIEFVNARNTTVENKNKAEKPRKFSQSPRVLTKSRKVPINTGEQSSQRAAASVSTARHVNNVASRPNVNSALPITYSYFKAHSPGNPQYALQHQGIFDSGCSRAMTRNKSYFTDYREIDGGFVAFGGNAKGGPKSTDDEVADDAGKKSTEVPRKENRVKDPAKEGEAANTNSINRLNTVSSPVNTISSSFTTVDQGRERAQRNKFESMFEQEKDANGNRIFTLDTADTGIFNGVYNDEVDGAEVDFNNLELITFNCLLAYFLSQIEPKKVIQAFQDPSWIEAMQDELLQFKLQKVWRLVYLPKVKHAIGTKWVNRNKKDERGIVVRNKERQVAQGYTQEEGIDYNEVFSPVARIEAVRLFLAYASFIGFIVYQMDVKSVFLYGTIEEEMYVCQPPGFKDPHFPNKVYKVEKALYGIHQAPRAWYETLSTYLLKNSFKKGIIDKTLFIKKDKDDILLVQVYVDDIIFGSTKKSLCTKFKGLMHKKFQISSMGELTFFLGLQVMQKDDRIFIIQDKYVAHILKKFDFSSVKTASTPIETNKALLKDEEAEDVDVHLYRSMSGSLMYLTAFRPDIMFVVYACARFQVTTKVSHLHAVKRIFRYLKGQPKLGLWYPRDSPFDLEAFSNSDYAGASLDRKFTIGGCQFLGKRLISWKWKKQTVVANSTTKAEYVVAANCCGQVKQSSMDRFVDRKKIIVTEASIRRDLQLHDSEGIACLPNDIIFEELARMGTMAYAIICLANNQKFNFSKYIFDNMLKNLEVGVKFFMFPRFVQVFVNHQLGDMSHHKKIFVTPSLTPLFETMMVQDPEEVGEGSEEDASKQERMIDNIDQNGEVTLVDETQGRINEEDMFGVNDLDGDEVIVDATAGEEVEQSTKVAEKEAKDKGKGIMVEPEKTLKKKDQISFDEKVAKKLEIQMKAKMEEEERISREKDKANIALIAEWDDVQDMMDADHELAERLQAEELGELTIEERSKLFVELMNERKKHFARRRAEEKRIKPPTKTQKRKIMSTYLKNMLIKAKYGNTRPKEGYERVLWGDVKVMFEPDIEKKRYTLTPATITEMMTGSYKLIIGIKCVINFSSSCLQQKKK